MRRTEIDNDDDTYLHMNSHKKKLYTYEYFWY